MVCTNRNRHDHHDHDDQTTSDYLNGKGKEKKKKKSTKICIRIVIMMILVWNAIVADDLKCSDLTVFMVRTDFGSNHVGSRRDDENDRA
jgi:hypothetical protein